MKVASFVTGLGVGAALAMLFAPRSGEDTREILSEKAAEGGRYAKERAGELGDVVRHGREVGNRQKAAVQAAKDT